MTDPAPTRPRLCIDCRFARLDDELWTCMHPTSRFQPPPDLVTGEPVEAYQLRCRDARIGLHREECGEAGKYWEART
jgi:hypothetical protein